MGILAVYDTIGIQNYIFSSNKLAENVGASKLVADVFGGDEFAKDKFAKDGVLASVIKKYTGSQLPDWRKSKKLDPSLKAEIIYQGGGNAYVKFADEPTFQDVTKAFLIEVSKYAPGIGIAVAAVETNFGSTYKRDFDNINDRLMLVKGGFNMPVFAGNQPITKQSGRTGLPVSHYEDREYMSNCQKNKRERYDDHKIEKRRKRKSKIYQFNDLVFEKESDSLIAIVHADGNNMGKHIKEYMEGFKSYEEAVPAIRDLASKIDKCYRDALDRTIEEFEEAYEKYVKEQIETYPGKEYKTEPPYLELIGDGDDITVLIGGRFAIDFAARLLREIEKTKENKRPFIDKEPTACAGVVLFHSHYPFSEAYKLVEGLCSNAKKPSRAEKGSYIDFHLHSSGRAESLQQLRTKQYFVDGKSIIKRPWKVPLDESKQSPGDFSWFEKSMAEVSKIPKNKTKAIRNAIASGDIAARLAENQLRDAVLPKYPQDMPDRTSEYAALFDILEFYDTYVNLLN